METTVGTDASLAVGDGALNAYDIMFQASIPEETREAQGSFDYLGSIPGGRTGTATFKTDIGWDGSATLPFWATVLLPACGWVNTSGTFDRVPEAPGGSGGVKTLTLGCYMNGKLKKLTGAMGDFRMVFPTGRACYIEWTFTGVWNAPTDVAMIAPTYPTDEPAIRYASGTATYNSAALKVEQVAISAGNEITMREDPTNASGFCNAVVTNAHSSISANPEAALVATRDPYGQWIAATEAALTVAVNGPGGSDINISAPKAQIVNNQEGDRNRIVTDELEFKCQKNGATANEALTFTFNEA